MKGHNAKLISLEDIGIINIYVDDVGLRHYVDIMNKYLDIPNPYLYSGVIGMMASDVYNKMEEKYGKKQK